MKKSRLLIAAAGITGLALFASGCGFSTGGEDYTVTVIEATPTPTPEPTPEVVATPTPAPTATPAPEISQTAGGTNIVKQDGTYTATADVNVRADCSTDAAWVMSVTNGTAMTSTGVSEDGQWIEVNIDGTVGYVSAQYAAAASADAAASTDTAASADASTDTAAADTASADTSETDTTAE